MLADSKFSHCFGAQSCIPNWPTDVHILRPGTFFKKGKSHGSMQRGRPASANGIIVPYWRTVSPEFFLWVRTWLLLFRHSCPVRSASFPNQKRRNYRWVEKRFGCYQQEQFNLHWENSVSDGSQCIVNNRKFKMKRRRESKKSNSLTRQNNNFARASRFFVHFFAVTARLPRENA